MGSIWVAQYQKYKYVTLKHLEHFLNLHTSTNTGYNINTALVI